MSDSCLHYHRPLFLFADCCKQWVRCHICHNEQANHEMERYKVQNEM